MLIMDQNVKMKNLMMLDVLNLLSEVALPNAIDMNVQLMGVLRFIFKVLKENSVKLLLVHMKAKKLLINLDLKEQLLALILRLFVLKGENFVKTGVIRMATVLMVLVFVKKGMEEKVVKFMLFIFLSVKIKVLFQKIKF